MRMKTIKRWGHRWCRGAGAWALVAYVLLYSCASIGTPDGGAYDEAPPVIVKTTPTLGALNNGLTRIVIEFDEYVKLDNATEKVAISPPQLEQPEVKTSGKKVIVELFDTLKEETTYTIDFSDAIVDNNESNPLGDFTFTFSTGGVMDTLEVAGTVIEAETLEPVKNILVGLHRNLADSAFVTLPFDRVARTDSKGRFTIRGIAPGEYRIYALMDANQNYIFDQKSEKIAFNREVIVPTSKWDIRYDTIWRDTLTWDSIREVNYTHYLPDDIILKAFTETPINQYMAKSERLHPTKFSFYFAIPNDTLPTVEGLNFSERDAFIIERSAGNDTVHYWIRDSTVYNLDTLAMRVTYLFTDTTATLVPRTDTLELTPKTTWEAIHKEEARKIEEWKKEQKKKNRQRNDSIALADTIPPREFLKVNIGAQSCFCVEKDVEIRFDEPLAVFNRRAIHLTHKVDTTWEEMEFEVVKDTLSQRRYTLHAEWRPTESYKLEIDSLAFVGIYGLWSDRSENTMKAKGDEEFSQLALILPNAEACAVAELLSGQEKVVKQARVENGEAVFYYVAPG